MTRRRLTIVSSLALLAGCPNDLEPIGGDTGGAEIPAPVQDVFDRRCAFAGCHGMGTAQGGLSLDAAASGSIVGGPSSAGIPMVTIGDICDSYLAIKLLPPENNRCGVQPSGDPMPPGPRDDPALQVDLALVLGWIAGADLGAGGGTTSDTAGSSGGTTGGSDTGTGGSDTGTGTTGP
ncbi:MAG: hypothetical protein D6705_03695 [Deltaproteobacteria bacterium]|nr:MAG: hypothetical protein D6705_03695 [Deltaproteobacteria bacterium]